MTKEELIKKLNELAKHHDPESAHGDADDLLLLFINDPEITDAYETIEKWYA